ncbi:MULTISPECIES: P-loop NTPase [unclassified Oceanispirochaeta]|uniref:P-loop NTPase n=1 Tax=unclassified Oceanispirochaeta TaxID=2635722 RepID=UPI000E09DF06|nr:MULTISPECIES: P-loop NTPase [unclassified Oceanispirochaeta]MBF9015256.1 P-loop NTPase [Oceanispirochaeta sp. M2]NPD71714.1 P-loop NTPase [Oceanispirochaeta sp. M1]RDG32908.1 MinD/ParA family protein [Oceanispirochaeta sp. M1]
MQVIAVASGKGGVGKSLLASNMAIGLAENDKKVILADLDLGGSNLHLVIGQKPSTIGLGSFINNPKQKIEEIIQDTDYKNLRFISGEGEVPGAANITTPQKKKLINRMTSLDADYLVMDLGAGSNSTILDFFLIAGCGIIVTTPTLTATLNAYLFIKNVLFRMLYTSFNRKSPAMSYLETLRKDGVSLQKVYLSNLVDKLRDLDMAGADLFEEKKKHFQPRLVMNMMDNPDDLQKVDKLIISVRDYLGVNLDFLGVLYRDEFQKKALNSRLPVIKYKPGAVVSQGIYRICDKVLEIKMDERINLSNLDAEFSYQSAGMEAESDFNDKVQSLEELLHSGALTQGDLIETIRMQQYEINKLKKENRFIKAKLVKASESGFKV